MLYPSDSNGNRRRPIPLLALLVISIVAATILYPTSVSNGALICGDLDRSGGITAADIIWLINYVFKGGPMPEPDELADVNGDLTINLSDVIYLINYVYKGGEDLTCPPWAIPVISSGCKMFTAVQAGLDPPPNQDCLEWEYDGANQLHVRHVNAGFNCCPDEIVVNAYIDTGMIMVDESEYFGAGGGCDCLCLVDLDYTIDNVRPETYLIRIFELYTDEGDDPLVAFLPLTPAPSSGTACVERLHYPWHLATIQVDSSTGCKEFRPVVVPDSIPMSQDCVDYLYDTSGILHLTHINAGFNCCAAPAAHLAVNADTIIIAEYELYDDAGPCYCLCLYDVDYTIRGLARRAYVIRVVELHLDPPDALLEFPVDFALSADGSYCVARAHYPWQP